MVEEMENETETKNHIRECVRSTYEAYSALGSPSIGAHSKHTLDRISCFFFVLLFSSFYYKQYSFFFMRLGAHETRKFI